MGGWVAGWAAAHFHQQESRLRHAHHDVEVWTPMRQALSNPSTL